MRKELITALATKFDGVDARILGRIADNLLRNKTIESEEDVNSVVGEVTFSDILKSYGDSRAAEATKSAVSNYEKRHKLKDGKPAEQTEDPDDGEDEDTGPAEGKGKGGKPKAKNPAKDGNESELAALLKAMNKKLDDQAEEIQALKRGKVTETRKSRVGEIIKDLSAVQKKAYQRINVESLSDEDFNTLVDEITEEAAQLSREGKAHGAAFGIPLGGANHGTDVSKKDASEAELDAVIKEMNL